MGRDDEDDWVDEPSMTGLEDWDEEIWIAGGIAAVERYLARHAAFEIWCDEQARRYGRRPGRTDA